ncbi:MAG: FIST C-terminal domain-containing protein, partial [Magnetococcales bacterium]|nr:FIST C-terminal domain-containing protein [Magnetococcales bacterium]
DVNGSAIIKGLHEAVGDTIHVSGGLAGDGGAFEETLTVTPTGVDDRGLVAIGFYGNNLEFAFGSFGGWSPFGPIRKVTHAEGNILYKLDDEPAPNVYKNYLGEYAKDLPSSGLLFPFEMLDSNQQRSGLIRTILGVNEEAGSMVLAGDINPEGYLRLMHASSDDLADGAEEAAKQVRAMLTDEQPGLAVLVSCVGRKLVMGDHVDDEVESVLEFLPDGCAVTGFYSYGEFSPHSGEVKCNLHNQTMTIALIREKG